jgi:hypothetical protein
MMRNFVDGILAPYFNHVKAAQDFPPSQKSLWQINVWSVHHSNEFVDWMAKHHPTIVLDFSPVM